MPQSYFLASHHSPLKKPLLAKTATLGARHRLHTHRARMRKQKIENKKAHARHAWKEEVWGARVRASAAAAWFGACRWLSGCREQERTKGWTRQVGLRLHGMISRRAVLSLWNDDASSSVLSCVRTRTRETQCVCVWGTLYGIVVCGCLLVLVLSVSLSVFLCVRVHNF